MAVARIKNDDPTAVSYTAGADLVNAQIVPAAGLIGVVEALAGVKDGDPANARIKGHYYLPKASGTDFTEGGTVQFNFGTGLAVTSGGTTASKCVETTASGATEVLVLLNE